MKLEYYSPEKIKKEICAIVEKHLDLKKYRLFFFGSRVSGTANERSDIDVGIEGDVPVPSGALLAIQEDLDNLPTLYKIEIVDFLTVDERFKSIALQHTELINEPIL